MSRRRYRLDLVLASLIAIVWAWSAMAKLLDLASFEETVRAHGVLEEPVVAVVWLVPLIELVAAFATLPRLGELSRKGLTASLVLVVLLSVYLACVPRESLETVGCGCHGGTGVTTVLGVPIRTALLLANAVFMALHGVAFACSGHPSSPTERNRRAVRV